MTDDASPAPFYGDAQRVLQDLFGTRPLADTHEAIIVTPTLSDDQRAFVESRDFFFLSTIGHDGFPSVSYKGGPVGVVQAEDDRTLVFPSYDGNGMYLSLGNVEASHRIGMLFIDFERPDRLRVHATAELLVGDALSADPVADRFPGAEAVVRATIDRVWVNCARYIHKHTRVSPSPYVPGDDGNAPYPAWKKIDLLQPILPEKDRGRAEKEGGTITAEEYAARLADGTS